MKLNRNSKKWVDLYNNKLKELIDEKGTTKCGVIGQKSVQAYRYLDWLSVEPVFDGPFWARTPRMVVEDQYGSVDAMPDRIKEAEEYADRLFSAMR